MTQEELKMELEELAVRFSKGWHEGIKIDASDIMLLNEAAQALAQPEQEPCANHCEATAFQIVIKNLRGEIERLKAPQRTEQEQEPVIGKWSLREVYFDEDGEPISHRSPPQRKPLTEQEMFEAIRPLYSSEKAARLTVAHSKDEYQAIEAAHGIKENT
jgi:hypothetical protein